MTCCSTTQFLILFARQPFRRMDIGEQVAGTYRQRLTLASGHVAMIDVGFGFQRVPWTPPMENISAVIVGSTGLERLTSDCTETQKGKI